jgi:hypothetical protein
MSQNYAVCLFLLRPYRFGIKITAKLLIGKHREKSDTGLSYLLLESLRKIIQYSVRRAGVRPRFEKGTFPTQI